MLDLNFTYTEADMRAFSNYFYLQGKGRRSLYLIGGGVLLFIVYRLFQDGISPTSLMTTLVPTSIFIVAWWFVYRMTVRRAINLSPQMQEPRRCHIGPEGLKMQAETFLSEYDWNAFQNKVETSEAFLLFTSPMTAVILPKRAFSPEQLTVFRQYMG